MAAEDEDEMDPRRVRLGLALLAAVMVVAVGVFITVEEPAARFLFAAIIVIGVFQTWRLFRSRRRK